MKSWSFARSSSTFGPNSKSMTPSRRPCAAQVSHAGALRVSPPIGRFRSAGEAFAPALGTYAGIDARTVKMTSIADSGRAPDGRRPLANLHPLAAAALYEVALAREAGPLNT